MVGVRSKPSSPLKPMSGMVVVDLTRYVSGSYATMLLSSLGADVIKVEEPNGGDPYRSQGTATVDSMSTLYLGLNSGKRSLALDIKSTEGQEILERLLAKADVFAENSRPGSLDKLNLGYEQVHERHPSLVYTSVSGYGDTGPDRGKGGFDLILQAASGIMSVTGTEGVGPTKVGSPILDIGAGISAALGTVSALLAREHSGEGAHVTSSLLEFGIATFTSMVTTIRATGEIPSQLGSHSPTFSPYGGFKTGDGYLVLAGAGNEALWIQLCEALGLDALSQDARFLTNSERVAHRDELTALLEERLASGTTRSWLEIFDARGIPSSSVEDLASVLSSPQVESLGILKDFQISANNQYTAVLPPFSIGSRSVYPSSAPQLGENTGEILRSVGVSDEKIRELEIRAVASIAK
ncbi:MAG: CoA transferase [Actinobacteria bacterium]|uniref:Unannotated protein n=1 Tax=freshwater metagenome TaxID=449393 RepID=A0A6J6SSK2_9ZZZZ|nr:CoA transferase [Actinomycetota bacterium]